MIRDWFARARSPAGEDSGAKIREIAACDIDSSPYQPRRAFDDEQLRELAESIKQLGVIEPVLVRRSPEDDERYQLVVGERRVRASRLAGLDTVPAVVRDVDDEQMALLGLTENLQREDLHFIEEAEAFRRIVDKFCLTQQELAERLGMKQSTISNKMRLLSLDHDIRKTVRSAGLGERHARALLRLPDSALQHKVLSRAVDMGASAREMDELVSRALRGEEPARRERQRVTRFVRDLRIYLNSLHETVQTMRESGLSVDMQREDDDDVCQVVIRISKEGMKSGEGKLADRAPLDAGAHRDRGRCGG